MQKYKNIQEAAKPDFKHIIAGAFFQMQSVCVGRLPEINQLINGDILYIDVEPSGHNQQLLLCQYEREVMLKQLGAQHFLQVNAREWPVILSNYREQYNCKAGIYQGPFLLSGLTEKEIETNLLQDFLLKAFGQTDSFNWHQHLGYYFPLSGEVVYGNKVGRKMGFPTLNIQPEDKRKIIPPMGVYAGMMKHKEKWHKGMINIGIRPTLNLSSVTIEAHIFDFAEELYGEQVIIHFTDRIRNELRFSSLDALKEQLHKDRLTALEMLDAKRMDMNDEADFLMYPG